MRLAVLLMAAGLAAVPATYAARAQPPDGSIRPAGRSCAEHLTEQVCLDQKCYFCESKEPVAGYTGCFEEAHLIPKSFYSCKGSKQAQQRERLAAASARKQPAVNPTDPCDGKPDAKSCDALDECTWCKSAAVPSSCFTVAQAKFLPPAVFVCDKKPPSWR